MEKQLNFTSNIEFIEDEALASVSLNPLFQWVKLIVCDDQKNLNNQKIPATEFDNIVRTGINAPIKMAVGSISDGHDEAFGHPIGTITNLKVENNQVKAIGALWRKERPEDIAQLKRMYLEGELPQVSWEIAYSDSSLNEDGVEELHNVILNGLAVVGMPAYAGRTPIFSMASSNNSNSEEENVEELEQLKAELETIKATLAEKEQELSAKAQAIVEKEQSLAEKEQALSAITEERDSLAEFKSQVEAEKEKEAKLASIKTKFSEAGIEKDEEYFKTNEDRLMNLSVEELDFMLQELVAFAQSVKSTDSNSSVKIPPFSKDNKDLDPKALGKALRELNFKQ